MTKNRTRIVIEIGFIVFLFYSNLLMGEFDYVAPLIAGWFVPLAVLLAAGLVILRIQQLRGFTLRDLIAGKA